MPDIRLTLPDDLLERIDQARGDIPRTVWIRGACEQRLAPHPLDSDVAPDGSTVLPGNTGVAGGTKHATPVPVKDHPFKDRPGTMRCAVCGVTRGKHA